MRKKGSPGESSNSCMEGGSTVINGPCHINGYNNGITDNLFYSSLLLEIFNHFFIIIFLLLFISYK